MYYKEAVGAVVVYDANRAPTFEAVKKWKNDIDAKVTLKDQPIPCILLANKVGAVLRHYQATDEHPHFLDRANCAVQYACLCSVTCSRHQRIRRNWMTSAKRMVFRPGELHLQPTCSSATTDFKSHIWCDRFETSAKTGANVEKSIHQLVTKIHENDKANQVCGTPKRTLVFCCRAFKVIVVSRLRVTTSRRARSKSAALPTQIQTHVLAERVCAMSALGLLLAVRSVTAGSWSQRRVAALRHSSYVLCEQDEACTLPDRHGKRC